MFTYATLKQQDAPTEARSRTQIISKKELSKVHCTHTFFNFHGIPVSFFLLGIYITVVANFWKREEMKPLFLAI